MNALIIDVGGTWTRLSRTDGRRLGPIIRIPTPPKWTRARRHIVLASDRLMAGKKVQRVIIGLPGTLDKKHSSLTAAPNLKGWVGQPLARDLHYIFQAPITLENDATLNGLGEAVFGRGKGYAAVGFITISTGVNGVLCVDGKVDQGAIPYELRRMLVAGQRGAAALEKLVSGHALRKRYGRPTEKMDDQKIWHRVSISLAFAVQNLMLAWRPDLIILGGGLVAPNAIRPIDVQRAIKKTWGLPFPPPPVLAGRLGDKSGLWGAAALSTRKQPKT